MPSSEIHIQNPLHRTALRIISDGWRDYRIAGTNMPTIDECRRNAEQCLHWADEAANDEQRETLLEMARLWTQMELSPRASERRDVKLPELGAGGIGDTSNRGLRTITGRQVACAVARGSMNGTGNAYSGGRLAQTIATNYDALPFVAFYPQ